MSQARRQRREMYKRFGILGDKSPQAKQLKSYLNNLTQNVSFEENIESFEENNESVDGIVEEMLEDVIEDAVVVEDDVESEEIKETEEDGTEQEG
jgi:alcohol dehydrogenase class IV